jgi:hypothetical protein
MYVRVSGWLEQPGGRPEWLHPADESNNTLIRLGAALCTGGWTAGAARRLPRAAAPS